jgi:glycosyltransferase involved in cell wall biosynthesis
MKKKLRITYLITGLHGGGAETMLFHMLRLMDRERFEQVVVSLMDRGKFGDPIEQMGIPVHTIGLKPGHVTPAAFWRLVKIMRASRPDVIQGWMYHANLAAQLVRFFLHVPVCWCIQSSFLSYSAERPLTRLAIWLTARMSRRAAKVVYVSQVSRTQHEQLGFAHERGCVIPNGADPVLFQPSAAARQSVREELGLPPDTLLVGLICRYHQQKDHPNFLQAAAIVARKWPEVRFVLVGSQVDGKNAEITELVEKLDLGSRVHLLGERNDMPRLTAALDIATSSSRYGEALALALAEAMACEVPCVVTDVGDSGLLVGDTGVIVPPSDPEAFAAGVDRLLAAGPEKRKELGKAARTRAEKGYSIQNITRSYEELYLSLK